MTTPMTTTTMTTLTSAELAWLAGYFHGDQQTLASLSYADLIRLVRFYCR